MKNNMWKRIFAAGCTAALIMTSPGVVVLADELPEESISESIEEMFSEELIVEMDESGAASEDDAAEVPVINENEQPADDEEEDIPAEDSMETSEETENSEEEFADESEQTVSAAEEASSEELSDTLAEAEEDRAVQNVGANSWTVGDGVTATFNSKTGELTFSSNGGTLWNYWQSKLGIDVKTIKSIKAADGSGKIYFPADSFGLFEKCSGLVSINFNKFDTSRVTDMSWMFYQCSSLTKLDLSGFYTSKVTDMSWMFCDCSSLTTLNVGSFNTSNVTSMNSMFYDCGKLKALDLTKFNTSKVTDLSWMFYGCSILKALDLSKFNTSNVTAMYGVFGGCSNLTALNLAGFNTAKVTAMDGIFSNCSSLTTLNLGGFNTSKVKTMSDMFFNCSSLKTLDLNKFNTSNVTDMSMMFYSCSSLTDLNLGSFNTAKVTDMYGMFEYCSSLTKLDLSKFNTSKVTNMASMFYNCTKLTILDISGFDLSNVDVKDFSPAYMLYTCEKLQILKTPKKNTIDGIELPVTMYDSTGKKYTTLPKTSKSILLANTKKKAAEIFSDVIDPSLWYYDSVYWAVKNGVTSGMGEGTFQPKTNLSRAQAVTFLYNLAGKPDVSKLKAKDFSDVPKSAWYYNAVKWAVANKITSGYGTGTFQPGTTCTRAMIVTFLANYSKAVGTYKKPTKSSSFKDVAATAWYKSSVDWAVENDITSGYGQGTFRPDVTCNRAMMVTFLKKVAALPKV